MLSKGLEPTSVSSSSEEPASIPAMEIKSDVISPTERAFVSTIEIEPDVKSPIRKESALMFVESDLISALKEESAIIFIDPDVISPINEESPLMPDVKMESDITLPLNEKPVPMPTVEIESDVASPVTGELTLMSTVKLDSDIISLVSKTEVQSVANLPVIEEAFSAPSIESDQVVVSAVEEESGQTREAIEKNPVFSPSPVKKKRKFRTIRKFFSRLCCIRKVKDSSNNLT